MGGTISRRMAMLLAGMAAMAWAGLAQAEPVSFTVSLSGAQEVPPVQTSGKATAHLTYDPASRHLSWTVTYSGLSGPATMAHFHWSAPAGKNAPAKLWITKKGSEVQSPIKGEATLSVDEAKELMAGEWYVNIHTKAHPAGEIRAQVIVPKG